MEIKCDSIYLKNFQIYRALNIILKYGCSTFSHSKSPFLSFCHWVQLNPFWRRMPCCSWFTFCQTQPKTSTNSETTVLSRRTPSYSSLCHAVSFSIIEFNKVILFWRQTHCCTSPPPLRSPATAASAATGSSADDTFENQPENRTKANNYSTNFPQDPWLCRGRLRTEL